MSSANQDFSFMLSLFCIAFALPFITTMPIERRGNPLDKFIEYLVENNCSMPKEVELPFFHANLTSFSYLSTPLGECKAPEALEENTETFLLCKEVFDVFGNITCNKYNLPFPKINSSPLSENVCKDFAAIQNIIPEQNEYLSRRLSDDTICKVLCGKKYELLCKILLWSYDTQAKIKNALAIKVKEDGKEIVNSIAPNKDTSNEKVITVQAETDVDNHEEINEISDQKITPDLEDPKYSLNESTLSHLESVPEKPIPDQTVTNKNNLLLSSKKDEKLIKSNKTSHEVKSSVPSKVVTQPDTAKVSQKNVQNENIQPAKQNLNLSDKNIDQEENTIEKQSKNIKIENPLSDVNHYTNVSDNKNNQNGESGTSPDKENNADNINSNINSKPDEKPESSIIPQTEVYNDLNSIDFQDPENETKDKGKKTDLNKKVENPKESSVVSDGATSETDSKLLESTVLPQIPDKNEDLEQHQELKDPEQYNDSENEADYAKQEYDNGFSPSLKKDSDVKNSIEDGSNQMSSSSNIQTSLDSFPGHVPDDNRNYLPARNYLPEQEDSHFFFYFLSIVLILMAGYLIFHNKQKIIALIVEGRHERRRRSHGAGYKKLETK